MSITVEHVSAVTRKCDGCGKEEMRTVLGTDPEFAGLTWDLAWKDFSIVSFTGRRDSRDVCSKACFELVAAQEYDKL